MSAGDAMTLFLGYRLAAVALALVSLCAAANGRAAGPGHAVELNRLQATMEPFWEQQLHQGGIALEPGARYELALSARSAESGAGLLITTKQDVGPWALFGVDQDIKLGNAWRRFVIEFTADKAIPGQSRLTFQFANGDPATIWLADLSLKKQEDGVAGGPNLLKNPRFLDALDHWRTEGADPSSFFYVGVVSMRQLEKTLSP